jgi:hypothetical protein
VWALPAWNPSTSLRAGREDPLFVNCELKDWRVGAERFGVPVFRETGWLIDSHGPRVSPWAVEWHPFRVQKDPNGIYVLSSSLQGAQKDPDDRRR